VDAVEPFEENGVLFPSSGRGPAGRPPELLDTYVRLELPGLDPDRRTGVGLWIFRASATRVDRTVERLASEDLAVFRVSPTLLLVRSNGPRTAAELIELGAEIGGATEAL
jgi:hypothetical protein